MSRSPTAQSSTTRPRDIRDRASTRSSRFTADPGLDLGTIYNDMAEMFGDRHVVIYYDQRGGGRSDLPADTTRLFAPRQIQDLDDLRKHFVATVPTSTRGSTRCSGA